MESSPMVYSPFAIPHEQLQLLCQSQSFQLLRSYLSSHTSFCPGHSHDDMQTRDTWLLHRDLLHALIMPIVELFKRASVLAEAALCASDDLELAFSGEARGAYVWLQCFLADEPDWAQTRGCPACVTIETLSTEHHIRLTIAASLVSDASLSPETSLPHILPALRNALEQDEFWGPEYWTYLFDKAVVLSTGIHALITSCVDLEALVSSPVPHTASVQRVHYLYMREDDDKGARLRKSKLAKRQLRMRGEEMEIMRRCALQCWAKVAMPSRMRSQLLGREERTRRLTCP